MASYFDWFTQRRRMRTVRLEKLVKPKYKGLDAVREAEGEAMAVEEFFRRRRRGGRYHSTMHRRE